MAGGLEDLLGGILSGGGAQEGVAPGSAGGHEPG